MHYWKGPRQTLKEAPMRYSMDDDPSLFLKPGPGRKLNFELELLLVMILMTCFAGHTIIWLSSNLISFIHVKKKELTSESDIWKRHAKSCTKSPKLSYFVQ
jgi:hypothetical protein